MQLKAISLGNFLGSYLPSRHVLALGLGSTARPWRPCRRRKRTGRSSHHHALDGGVVVQRLQRHHQLRRGAVGIGDDVLLGVAGHRAGVHLRHDQRHVLVVAPGRGIIDDHAALGGDARRPFLRHAAACRHQAEVHLGEIELFEVLAFERRLAERNLDPDRPARSQRVQLPNGELALAEDRQHFPAHIARGTDDGDVIAHESCLSSVHVKTMRNAGQLLRAAAPPVHACAAEVSCTGHNIWLSAPAICGDKAFAGVPLW